MLPGQNNNIDGTYALFLVHTNKSKLQDKENLKRLKEKNGSGTV
jgi:hypothetical protein